MTKPISSNLTFFLFTYVLAMVTSICTVLPDAGQHLYEYAWAENFVNVYATCCLLTLCPRKVRTVLSWTLAILVFIISLIDVYCYAKFSTPITPSMLMLVAETDAREAGEFLTTYLSPDILFTKVGLVFLTLLIPLFTKVAHRSRRISVGSLPPRYANIGATIFLIICLVLSFPNYVRFHSLMTQPTIGDIEHRLTEEDRPKMFHSAHRLAFSLYANHLTAKQIDILYETISNAHVDSCSVTSPNIVLIIGEAYNKHHSQLYGYQHATTPYQLAMRDNGNLVTYTDVVSPWNLTSYVFKHIMSTYIVGDKGDWCDYPLFTSLFRKAGYHVSFFTNEFMPDAKQAVYDFSGGFFLNDPRLSAEQFDTRNTQLYLFDESMLREYDSKKHEIYGSKSTSIDSTAQPHLTIFHLIGQHVRYKIRCPQSKKVFKADDYNYREDLSAKERHNLSDYDNATHYNDIVINEIVKRFQNTNTIIIYMPDHGEAVHPKENPSFHGRMHSAEITAQIARDEFEIPFWIYATPEYQSAHPELWQRVKSAAGKPYMTDALPHLLLYLGGIHCPYYRENLNILSPKYDSSRPRILKHQTDYDKVMKANNLDHSPVPALQK